MIVLDTHVWWWSLVEPENLSKRALSAIQHARPEQRVIASISIWELAMMAAKKRIELTIGVEKWLSKAIDETGITVADLSPAIVAESCSLPGMIHKDPADRIIVATARVHDFALLTKDRKIQQYPHVKSIW